MNRVHEFLTHLAHLHAYYVQGHEFLTHLAHLHTYYVQGHEFLTHLAHSFPTNNKNPS